MASPGKTRTSGRPYSGPATNSDPTNQPGQYPVTPSNDIFGGPLPTGTGAPGTPTGAEALDPTNEKGQTIDGLTGISHEEIVSTGAPGSRGAVEDFGSEGGTPMAITDPAGLAGIGPYTQAAVSDELYGPQDSTQANDSGYATSGPKTAGLEGNEPEANVGPFQPAGGHVMRGGRMYHGG